MALFDVSNSSTYTNVNCSYTVVIILDFLVISISKFIVDLVHLQMNTEVRNFRTILSFINLSIFYLQGVRH